MTFTEISLENLDNARAETHKKLKEFSALTGKKYTIRTFFLGPRRNRQISTLKSDARAAKIAIYEVNSKGYKNLVAYV